MTGLEYLMKAAGFYVTPIEGSGLSPTQHADLLQGAGDTAAFRDKIFSAIKAQAGPKANIQALGSSNFTDDIVGKFKDKHPEGKVTAGDIYELENKKRRLLGLLPPKKLPEGYGALIGDYHSDDPVPPRNKNVALSLHSPADKNLLRILASLGYGPGSSAKGQTAGVFKAAATGMLPSHVPITAAISGGLTNLMDAPKGYAAQGVARGSYVGGLAGLGALLAQRAYKPESLGGAIASGVGGAAAGGLLGVGTMGEHPKKRDDREKKEERKGEKKASGLSPDEAITYLPVASGTTAGALSFGLASPKGKKVENAIRGAGVGAGAGIGSLAGYFGGKAVDPTNPYLTAGLTAGGGLAGALGVKALVGPNTEAPEDKRRREADRIEKLRGELAGYEKGGAVKVAGPKSWARSFAAPFKGVYDDLAEAFPGTRPLGATKDLAKRVWNNAPLINRRPGDIVLKANTPAPRNITIGSSGAVGTSPSGVTGPFMSPGYTVPKGSPAAKFTDVTFKDIPGVVPSRIRSATTSLAGRAYRNPLTTLAGTGATAAGVGLGVGAYNNTGSKKPDSPTVGSQSTPGQPQGPAKDVSGLLTPDGTKTKFLANAEAEWGPKTRQYDLGRASTDPIKPAPAGLAAAGGLFSAAAPGLNADLTKIHGEKAQQFKAVADAEPKRLARIQAYNNSGGVGLGGKLPPPPENLPEDAPDAAVAQKPEAPAPAPTAKTDDPSWVERNWPYMAGAGALGLGGMYLMNRNSKKKKKKKDDDDDDDEKEASVRVIKRATDAAGTLASSVSQMVPKIKTPRVEQVPAQVERQKLLNDARTAADNSYADLTMEKMKPAVTTYKMPYGFR